MTHFLFNAKSTSPMSARDPGSRWRTGLMVSLGILLIGNPGFADFATSGPASSRSDQPRRGLLDRWLGNPAPAQEEETQTPSSSPSLPARARDPFANFDDQPQSQSRAPGPSAPPATGAAPYPSQPTEQDRPSSGAISQNPQAQHNPQDSWIHPSIVRVRSEEKDGTSNGSGTLIGVDDKHGYVITNWHVVRGATGDVTVEFPDGFQSAATVLKMDSEWDLAMLVIWKPTAPPMPLSPHLPSPGERLIIAGYGQGAFRSAEGKMTEFVAPNENSPFEMFEVSTEARQGDSGGPIVNMQGQLAGVLFGAGAGRTTGSHVGRLRAFLREAFEPSPDGTSDETPLPEAIAEQAPAAEAPRSAAQQPAAFHQDESEVDFLARQAVASLSENQSSELPLSQPDMPGIPGNPQRAATSNVTESLPLPPMPLHPTLPDTEVSSVTANPDWLHNIPYDTPYAATGPMASHAYGHNLPPAIPGTRGPMDDLKTFLAVFGVIAVVFMLLPRQPRGA